MKRLRILILIFLALIFIGSAGFIIWAQAAAPASSEAVIAAQSSATVKVEQVNGWQVFTPTQVQPVTGLIFYPGGRVDYRAYAPVLRPLAEKGYLVVVPQMPLNLAIFGINAADQIIKAYPAIKNWAIAGHSLGGSMASSYAKAHPDQIKGLVLFASYPAASDDLSKTTLKVISISASQDGLATQDEITASFLLLPATTQFVKIEGGNHAQFGSYGTQAGDLPASITPQAQWSQVSDAAEILLQDIGR